MILDKSNYEPYYYHVNTLELNQVAIMDPM